MVGRLAFDGQVTAQRIRGRRAQFTVGLVTVSLVIVSFGAQASEPDQFVLRGANQFGRIGLGRCALGGLGVEPLQRRDDHGPEPVAAHAR